MRSPLKATIAVATTATIASAAIAPVHAHAIEIAPPNAAVEQLNELANRRVAVGPLQATLGQIAGVIAASGVGIAAIALAVEAVKWRIDEESPKEGAGSWCGTLDLEAELYQRVIAHPAQYAVAGGSSNFVPDGTYSYALVDATGDRKPELLLRQNGTEINPVTVFTVRDYTIVSMKTPLDDGASSGGGFRATVFGSVDGTGLYQLTRSAGEAMHTLRTLKLGNGNLEETARQEVPATGGLPQNVKPLKWCSSSDSSCLRNAN